MAVADVASGSASGAAIGGPWGAVLGGGLSLLGGLFGGKKKPSTTETTTSTALGQLPPELQELLMQSLMQSGALSEQLGGELLNMPGALSLGALSGSAFGGLGNEILNQSGLTPGVQRAFDEATQGSFDLSRRNLERDLGFLSGEAEREAGQTIQGIRGALGASGLRGSTVGGGAIANALSGINARLGQAIGQGQAQLGQLGVANLQQRAQGLLQAQGLSQQGRLGVGNLLLGQRGQQIGLRGMADTNLMQLLSNPLTAQLFQRQLATATTTQKGKSTGGGGGGVASALGGIGGMLLQNSLQSLFPQQASS